MRQRVVLVGIVLLLVVVGWLSVAGTTFTSPQAAVERYFRALAVRDLGTAVDQLLSSPDDLSYSMRAALRPVLADARYKPPTNVRLGGWQHAATEGGERVVAVQYELGDTTHSDLLKVKKQDGVWRIVNGLGTVGVNVDGVAVNGNRLTGKNLRLFPGVYEVGTAPNAKLLTAPPTTVVVTPDRAANAELRATLAGGALEAVKRSTEAILHECERSGVAAMSGCPFKVQSVTMKRVQWTILSRPELVIEQTEQGVVSVRGSGPGSVRFVALDGDTPIDRVDSFSVDGKCVEIDDRVSCTFST